MDDTTTAARRQKFQRFFAQRNDYRIYVGVTNFFGIVKTAELASQGFWTFDRTAIVILGRIAAL
jgi:hypothetical protein